MIWFWEETYKHNKMQEYYLVQIQQLQLAIQEQIIHKVATAQLQEQRLWQEPILHRRKVG